MRKPLLGRSKFWTAIAGMLAVLASLCGPGVAPAQASHTAASKPFMHAGFMTVEPGKVCLWKKIAVEGYFTLIDSGLDDRLGSLAPEDGEATLTLKARLGNVTPEKVIVKNIWRNKIETHKFTYTARKAGHEILTLQVTWNGESAKKTLEFDVTPCNYKLQANADMTKSGGAFGGLVETSGFFVMSGTVVAAEDGIHGEGTTDLFMEEEIFGSPCNRLPYWEGSSSISIDGNVGALTDDGMLKLTINLEPMPVSGAAVRCLINGAEGTLSLPSFALGSFNLEIDPLSADGGTTTRSFTFPNAKLPFDLELTVSPEAAS